MNILHHKSWHVRTKANMQRVRRDEAKAAEEEQRILDRQIQAENERRINVLRNRAEQKINNLFGESSSEAGTSRDVCISDETGHVNLFQDLEREERKNLGAGNKEYEEEKAKEKREWESKMGIQVYFAENTNDLDKKKEWYETMPMRKAPDKQKTIKHDDLLADRRIEKIKRKRDESDSDSEMDKKKKKKHKKEKKKKKKHKKHRDSSEERNIEKEYEKEKRKRLELLRDERLKRERMESARTYALLHPEEIKKKQSEEQSKRPKYNSQFNPDLARR